MTIKGTRVALAALLVTLAYAGAAHGERLTFSPVPAENIEFTSEGLTFADGRGTFSVTCPVTLSGSMSETSFTMTEGTQFGSINRSSVSGCSGGSFSFLRLAEAPSRLTYRSFLGTLPNMTAIRHRMGAMALQATGIFGTCLYTGDVDALMELREIDAWTVGASTISTGRLTLSSGACPESATLSGRMTAQNMQLALVPIMQFVPDDTAFGSVRVEETRIIPARFENITSEQIEITGVRLRGAGCASYTYSDGLGQLRAGNNLAGNGKINIEMTFRPRTTGRLWCDLEIKARQGGIGRQRSLVAWGRGI